MPIEVAGPSTGPPAAVRIVGVSAARAADGARDTEASSASVRARAMERGVPIPAYIGRDRPNLEALSRLPTLDMTKRGAPPGVEIALQVPAGVHAAAIGLVLVAYARGAQRGVE